MQATCPHCGYTYDLPDSVAGRRAKCKKCLKIFLVKENVKSTHPLRPAAPLVLFKKLWLGCPPPFRTAFLSTLGVLAALVFAYYFMMIPALQKSNPKPAVNIESPKKQDLAFIASVFQLQNNYNRLILLQQIRIQSAKNSTDLDGTYVFTQTLRMLQPEVEKLYMGMRKLNLPDHDKLNIAYSELLGAIEAEYNFLNMLLKIPGEKEMLKQRADLDEQADILVDRANLALLGIFLLYYEIDPDFATMYSNILGDL